MNFKCTSIDLDHLKKIGCVSTSRKKEKLFKVNINLFENNRSLARKKSLSVNIYEILAKKLQKKRRDFVGFKLTNIKTLNARFLKEDDILKKDIQGFWPVKYFNRKKVAIISFVKIVGI